MAEKGEERNDPAVMTHYPHHHPHVHHQHHPPLPHHPLHHQHHPPHRLVHQHSHSPHCHHYYHQYDPPPPFLCGRCKRWNFPFNPNPFLYPYANPAVCVQAQELPPPSTDLQAEEILLNRIDCQDGEDEEENYELVMTDEWMEFFAKSEARRQERKRQQNKAARDMHKATRARSQAQKLSTAE